MPTVRCGSTRRLRERKSWGPSVFSKHVVRVAVQPALTRLRGSDDGVPRGTRVFGGVTIRRVVATMSAATLLARAEVHPHGTDLHALLTLTSFRVFHAGDRGD